MTGNKDESKNRELDASALKQLVSDTFNKATLGQQPAALNTVRRLRRVHPDKSPAELVEFLNKTYLTTVTASGTGAGMASVIPNGVVQVPIAIADLAAFLEASVLYVLALAEIYGVNVEDLERRRFLVMAALIGNSATTTITQALGKKTIPYWSGKIINKIPMAGIKAANKVLGPRFITKYGAKQGILVLGKQLPLALGAVVGAGGNVTFGYFVIRSTKTILQAPPESWEHMLEHDSETANSVANEETEALN